MLIEKKEYSTPVTDLTELHEEDIILTSLGSADENDNRTEVDNWWNRK